MPVRIVVYPGDVRISGVSAEIAVARSPAELRSAFDADDLAALVVDLEPARAKEVLERLLQDVELFLDCHLVHGDLSAYNVLWWGDRPRIIDVPQSIDLHSSRNGYPHLRRDVQNLQRYFARYGLSVGDFAESAWRRYQRGQLGR